MKIAIIQGKELYNENYEELEFIAKTITDWTEVTKEDVSLLEKACRNLNTYCRDGIYHRLIIQPVLEKEETQESFIFKTIEDYKKHLEKVEEENKKRLAEEERKKQEKKARRELKTKEQKLKLFEDLKKELGKE